MADQLNGIIAQLERQKTAIERALAALRDIDGTAETTPAPTLTDVVKRKGGMTPARRRRLSEALKKRWAAKKAATGAPAAASPQKPAQRRVRITPEGRQRLAEAMRRRWAVKRTAAQAKKRGRKAA
jgi:hypothetical protein